MSEITAPCTYFTQTGPQHTACTLELAQARAEALGIEKALVATTTGATGVQAPHLFQGLEVIVVSYSAGFSVPNTQTFFDLQFLEIICMPSPGHPGQGQ